MNDKTRVDVAMVGQGLAESREKAQALIMSGVVYIKEQKVLKPSEKVSEEDEITVRGLKPHPYVSRGGLKLEKALRSFSLDVSGMTALDIGAATGGFTDVLLQNGAKHVVAVDVGYGQLDLKIRNDERVTVLERTNARYLTNEMIGGLTPDITVMDVSFISVKLILPAAAELMKKSGIFCILIKPQFEAGRENVGKHGVVRENSTRLAVIKDIRDFAVQMEYTLTQLDYSPIRGPAGNVEFLALIQPASLGMESILDTQIETTVIRAEKSFVLQ
ncbi:MAG TPA: TlyA family RNA methyltransferase [Candidatus Limiplasma sp.]|nr:TlyA family RNA methyltransferase [Candidatus Limiplasma sp.]HRX09209.1 TlyA family RNA methyltransferase [Candidatus Limiplasma sp.]